MSHGYISDAPFWREASRPAEHGGAKGINPLSMFLPILTGQCSPSYVTSPTTATSTEGEPILAVPSTNEPTNEEAPTLPAEPTKPAPPQVDYDFSNVSDSTLRLLQATLMFAAPLDQLRYVVPAMSLSWSSSCVVDKTNRVVTHGLISPPAVSNKSAYRSCVCGDTFVALLSDNNEVHVAGQLEAPQSISNPSAAHDPQQLRNMCGRVKMIAGHGSKLLALTNAHTVRPLSLIPANTKTLIPYRLCKYITTGLGDDCYMVGHDDLLYKTTASPKAIGTPRRVMTFCRIGISRLAAGAGFLVVIDLSGRVYTLGKNKKGQLGNGQKQDSMRKPYLHTDLNQHFIISAAAGDYHSLVLSSSGEVYACGSNEHGQLGLGEKVREALVFTKVALPAFCTSIVAGPSGSLFACSDGKVYACGFNESGLLGVEPLRRGEKVVFTPSPMQGIEEGVREVSLGELSLGVRTNEGAHDGAPREAKVDGGCCKCCVMA